MSVKMLKPTTPGQRGMSKSGFEEITSDTPERSLISKKTRTGGRSNTGRNPACLQQNHRGCKKRVRL